MSDVLDKISGLSPAKQELLLERLKRRRAAEQPMEEALGPSSARSRGEPLPLSFAQERLWFLHRLAPDSPAYHIPAVVMLRGRLVSAALAQALRRVVDRHESLRSRFPAEDGRPRLGVVPPGRFRLPRVDLSRLGAADRSGEARRQLGQLTRRPFDVARGPVLRVALVRGAATEHRLALVIHHIAFDGWSRGILVREVAVLYEAFLQGRPAEIPELPIQYADFAHWQRRRLSGDRLEELLDHWSRRLEGAPPVLDFPTDRPPPPRPSGRGRRRAFRLSPELSTALRALARRCQTTLFTVITAGFAAFLGRHAGQDDVVVGTPVAGRDRAKVEGLVGLFVNTLALRIPLDGEPTGWELVTRAHETVEDAFEHRELPFERLVAHLAPDRSSGRPPIFQAMVVLQNLPSADASLPGLELALEETAVTTAKVDLTLHLTERPHGSLAASFEYATDLFDATTMARWADRLPRFMEHLARIPDHPVADLPLASPAERHETLWEWGGPRPSPDSVWSTERTLVDLFLEQVAAAPDRVAVTDGDLQVSYDGLWNRARDVALGLRARNVEPENRVALRLERSAELVTAILGVLAAGAAYVPLDPSHPEQRQRFVTDDAGTTVEIDSLPYVAPPTGARGEVPGPASPHQAAYVIYTSGSTGQPKGVVVTHAHAVRLWSATVSPARFDFTAEDVWTLFHSPAFDFSVWEIWGALLFGGRLVVVPHRTSRSPDAFADLLARERVTVLNQTPSAFRQLQAEDARRDSLDLVSLRWVIFGGEALEPTTLASWMRRHGDGRDGRGPRLVNMYGITETTVHVTYRELETDDERSVIGRPVDDLGLVLLDHRGRTVPLGVVGEIHVAGAGLARGYLGRPSLTAARFLPDAFFDAPGGRLYRSGDLARWRPVGDLEFLGRLDHQVQLRGFRIELGEIEAALVDHPAVQDTAVLPRGTGDSTRLIAYVVPQDGTDAARLRDHAGLRLPDYMIPSAFVFLDGLPLTANGKVDRRALAELETSAAPAGEDERVLEPPRTPREEILAGLFAEVLELDRIGATESFFDLGGHSLLATRLVARARQALDVEIPLGALFEHPTVRDLAKVVECFDTPGEDTPPPLEPVPRHDPLPLSFSQERLWFLDRLEPGTPAYDISLRLRFDGSLASRRLGQSLTEVVRRHESLRTRFPESSGSGDEAVQQVEPARRIRWPVVDLVGLSRPDRDGEGRRLAREAAFVSFDLARGPLLATALVRTAPERHLFLFTVHHIAADGWSLGVLSRELTRLYGAFGAGRPSGLPEPPIQYPDYAAWQRTWLTGPTLERHVEHWRERLVGVADLNLPTDRPRPPVQAFRGGRVPWTLPAESVSHLHAVARRHGSTLFMVLAAGLRIVLGRWSGQHDFALGTFVANRTRAETQDLIGFFVNNLALRTPLKPQRSFADQVERERETALAAYTHQQLPFETLLRKLDVPRDMSRSSLFQVMLVLQNTPRPGLDLPGVTVRSMAGKEGRANFDLTLWTFDDTDDGSLRGAFEYPTALFDQATVARMAGHLTTLLGRAAREPHRRLEDLPVLTGGERAQLLQEWSRASTASPTSPDVTLPERIRRIAGRRPDAVALVAPGDGGMDCRHVTYGELMEWTSRLTGRLATLDVGRGDRVVIYDERTPETLAAVLAVMERGAAYVPLDAAYGPARLPVVVKEGDVRVLMSRRQLLGGDVPMDLELVDLGARNPDVEPVPPLSLQPADAAYVMYTSGTTGRPKGVVVSHGGLSTLYRAWHQAYDLPRLTCHLQTASLSFDVFAGDWVRALGSGAKLLLVPSELRLQPEALWSLVVREGVDVGELVPALMRPILDLVEARDGTLAPFRLLLVGSDAWYLEEMRRVARRLPPGARLVDSYGVTEATVDSTWFLFEAATAAALPAEILAPIGRPFPGCRAWVVAPDRRLSPAGVPGELYLGGDGLAQGYLARPALTADRFVPDPFSGEPGRRAYRTGDRARWRADGHLELLGRMDQQLKVRGFRIEPGEIEAALGEHRQVRQAVVTTRGSLGEERLVAYVTTGEPRPTGWELRAFLAKRLPDYMVPAVYVPLDGFPLTPNGKVDRRALPTPDWGSSSLGVHYVPPRAGTESALAGLYGEILGGERIGAADGFFARGGHSLAATRLVSRVRRAFDVELPLRAVFEEPTVRGLGRRIDTLMGDVGQTEPPLEPVSRDSSLPLSFAQERLWFLDRLDPGRPTYHLFNALATEGPLDAGRLARALRRLGDRHEILRTSFATGGPAGEPRQHVADHVVLPVPVVDLSGLECGDRDREAQFLTREEAHRPFDLTTGPLLRLTLLRFAPDTHRALLTQHHVISDAWSMGIFWNELARLYDGVTELPPLPIQYADYAVWQRRWLTGPVLDSQLAYWRDRLVDLPPALELPADRPRPAVPSQRGGRLQVTVPTHVTARLRAVAEARETTLYMVVLAGFVALLHRLSGQDRLTVGTPVAHRTRAELEDLLGFFVNTLVMDADLADGPSFARLVDRIRETALGAFAHQDLPFEKLVEELAPERDLSRTPLFQAMLVFQNAPPVSAADTGDLSLRPLPAGTGTAKFDLGLELFERGDALAGHLEYATDLFDRTTVERWAGHLGRLLEIAATGPEKPVRELPLLSIAERHQLVTEWQDTRGTDAPTLPLDQIEAWIEESPDAVVATAPGRCLTWGELGRRAENLARRLRHLGVGRGPEPRVALRLEPSPETLVAIVATWKARGAYVPLDPSHPATRVDACLEDAEPAVLVEGAEVPSGRAVTIRPLGSRIEAGPYRETQHGTRGEHAAYVIYTSGSTGRPKGVAVSHGAVARLWDWHRRAFGSGRMERVALAGGPAFDVQVLELGAALSRGAALHAPAPETRRDPERLLEWMEEEGVTSAFLVAPMVEIVNRRNAPASLRVLFSGGDRLRTRPTPEASYRLVNGYGPTEATVLVTTGVVEPSRTAVSEAGRLPSIGRPHREATAHVVDRYLHPVPLGVAGELMVGGEGIARGYLGQPATTAAAFVPDPWSEIPGSRLYATGDRVRHRADGRLDFLDRRDDQVQIRGFRVEPGEIETVLGSHPAVRAAAILAQRVVDGGVRLDAFYEPADGETTPGNLRRFLRERLPEPMVPATLTAIETLPLTPNGKLDRRALAAWAPAPEPQTSSDGEEARTPVEDIVAGLWQGVLDLDRVGLDDDFFALGGHSLAATRIVGRLHETLDVEIPLKILFEDPTVRGWARHVEDLRGLPVETESIPLRARGAGAGELLPLAPAQERFWLLSRLDPTGAAYNVPLGLRLDGALSMPALQASLTRVTTRHQVLRSVFSWDGEQPKQRILPPSPGSLPVADLSGLPGKDRAPATRRLAREAARRPFDLERGPLVHPVVLRRSARHYDFVLTLPHAVADEGSLTPLLHEVTTVYSAIRQGIPAHLPPLPIQVADWAAWQRERLGGTPGEDLRAFWTTLLDPLPEPLDLPTDRPRPARRSYAGAQAATTLPDDLANRLARFTAARGATPFLGLLAVFQLLLARLTQRDRFVVGTPVSQRDRPELESLIGVFLNTLAVPADLSGEPTFEDFLHRVRNVFLAAHDHRDLPFESLLDIVAVERDLSRPPLVQVMLVPTRGGREIPHLPDLELTSLAAGTGTSKLDLTLTVHDPGTTDGHRTASLAYATDLFDATTARRILRLWLTLLEGALTTPSRPVSALDLLPATERHQVTFEWSGVGAPPVDRGDTLHGLVRRQARRTEDRVAIRSGEHALTFGELVRRTRIATRRLKARGVGPETLVGICLERSVEQILSVLAVLEAGGAYLPLDPDLPTERLALLVDDANAPWVLVSGATAGRLPVSMDDRLLPVEDLLAPGRWAPGSETPPDSTAYLIYTSGSTGRPKGVAVSHRAAAHRVRSQAETDLSSRCRFLHKTSLSFDVSVAEIFAPLTAGGQIFLARTGREKDAGYLARVIPREGITHASFPPTLLGLLLEDPRLTAYEGLVAVATGGETVPAELPPRFYDHISGPRLENRYGPTETTISVTCHRCPPGARETTLPIGRPLADAQVFLLDPRLLPTPMGVPGQIGLGGPCLARGYHRRPAATAEAFVPHPRSGDGPEPRGRRLYLTGDLGRWRADGQLEFLGRADGQVQIRGYRVELGEVEAALRRLPEVREAAVVDRLDSATGSRRLGAWVVPETDAVFSSRRAREALTELLPSYMVPGALAALDALPVGPTGKVDRQRLPEAPFVPEETVYEPPADTVEEVLAGMFAEILEVDRVGRHDDFFERGGHSLTAARLLTWVRESFEADIPLARVFEEPTVAALAADLRSDPAKSQRIERTAELLVEMAEMDEEELAAELEEEA